MTMVFDPVTSSAISRELHQTAQPLTVLQGLLELALLTSLTPEDYRGVIQRAMEQSRRISGCFDLVRKLVHFQQPPLDLSSFSVSDMTEAVVESVRDSYAMAGVGCEFHPFPYRHDSGIDVVTASEGRVSAALALILSNLPRWTRAGGTVDVAVEVDFQQVQVRIQARQQNAEPYGSSAADLDLMTAPLQLARTMITSTGGNVVQGEPEFSLLISLPKLQQSPEMYKTQGIECVHV
jgi:hypothetical protein